MASRNINLDCVSERKPKLPLDVCGSRTQNMLMRAGSRVMQTHAETWRDVQRHADTCVVVVVVVLVVGLPFVLPDLPE